MNHLIPQEKVECKSNHKRNMTLFKVGTTLYVRKEVLGILANKRCLNEVNALIRCKGINGIQEIVEQDSETSFVSHYVEGESLLESSNVTTKYFELLSDILSSMHDVGVADLDFGNSVDLLVTEKGTPVVIDLGATIVHTDGTIKGFIQRPLYEYVRKQNYLYLKKRQARYIPDSMTAEERDYYLNLGVIPNTWRKIRKLCN